MAMSEPRSVQRHVTAVRVFHWVYAAAFCALALTGFVLLAGWTPFAVGEAGQTSKLVHRISGVLLIVAPLVTLIFAFRAFVRDLKLAFTWGKKDIVTLMVLFSRTYWTGDTKGLPSQGRFMAGQKINIATHVAMWLALVVTGLVIWFGKGFVPQWAMQLMILVHALAAVGAVCFTIVHIYMVTTLPYTRDAIGAIFSGRMPEEVAKSHHPEWYAEVVGGEKK
jgi:formate dehydrogenase subunit gamma